MFRSYVEWSPAPVELRQFAISRAARSSDRTHSQLHQLKRKLLQGALEETPETGLFKRICGAANQAAALAWGTSHPLLVFPLLFEEMIKAVRELSYPGSPSANHFQSQCGCGPLRFRPRP
jgi:hypothetical protein